MRLSTRLSGHKNKDNTCVSKNLFVDNAIITIVLIENFACNNKNELKARELHHITTNNCINANKPFVCEIPFGDGKAYKKEYNAINAEQIKLKKKEYYAINAEQIKSKAKEYYAINAEQIKSKAKQYKDTNRDRANALQRARRAEKKLALNLQNNLNKNIIV